MTGKHLTLIDANFEAESGELGVCKLAVLRARGRDRFEVGFFYLDLWCLGVRDAIFFDLPRHEWERLRQDLFPDAPPVEKDGPWGRKLIEGAVEYARKLGFAPCRDYRKAARVFGGIKSEDCSESFTFGKDGKPCYIQAESDKDAQAEKIIARLRARCGDGNFNFMLNRVDDDYDWEEGDDAFEEGEADVFDAESGFMVVAEQAGGGPMCPELKEVIDRLEANITEEDDFEVGYEPDEHALADQLQRLFDGILETAKEAGDVDLEEIRYTTLINFFILSTFRNSDDIEGLKDHPIPGITVEMVEEALDEMKKCGLQDLIAPIFWGEDGFRRKFFHLDFTEEEPRRLFLVCVEGYLPQP